MLLNRTSKEIVHLTGKILNFHNLLKKVLSIDYLKIFRIEGRATQTVGSMHFLGKTKQADYWYGGVILKLKNLIYPIFEWDF